METRDHSKNGASPKSHTSKKLMQYQHYMFNIILTISIFAFIAFSYWIGGGYPYKSKISTSGFHLDLVNIISYVRTDEGKTLILFCVPLYGFKHFFRLLTKFPLIGCSYIISIVFIIITLVISIINPSLWA